MVDLIEVNWKLSKALEDLIDSCERSQDWDGTRIGNSIERARVVLWGTPEQGRIDPCPYCKEVHDSAIACPEYAATLKPLIAHLDRATGPDMTSVQIKCLKCEMTTVFEVEPGTKIEETDARCHRCKAKFEGKTEVCLVNP